MIWFIKYSTILCLSEIDLPSQSCWEIYYVGMFWQQYTAYQHILPRWWRAKSRGSLTVCKSKCHGCTVTYSMAVSSFGKGESLQVMQWDWYGCCASVFYVFWVALTYVDFGINLLAPGHWETDYNWALSVNLYQMSASLRYMCGDTIKMSKHAEENAGVIGGKVSILVIEIHPSYHQLSWYTIAAWRNISIAANLNDIQAELLHIQPLLLGLTFFDQMKARQTGRSCKQWRSWAQCVQLVACVTQCCCRFWARGWSKWHSSLDLVMNLTLALLQQHLVWYVDNISLWSSCVSCLYTHTQYILNYDLLSKQFMYKEDMHLAYRWLVKLQKPWEKWAQKRIIC